MRMASVDASKLVGLSCWLDVYCMLCIHSDKNLLLDVLSAETKRCVSGAAFLWEASWVYVLNCGCVGRVLALMSLMLPGLA